MNKQRTFDVYNVMGLNHTRARCVKFPSWVSFPVEGRRFSPKYPKFYANKTDSNDIIKSAESGVKFQQSVNQSIQ